MTDHVIATDLITQADRDAAIDFATRYLYPNSSGVRKALAQSFAKHRLEATANAEPVAWMYERGDQRKVDAYRWGARYRVGWTETPLYASPPITEALKEAREALTFFASVADEYDDSEDDSFEVWQDAGPVRNIRQSFRLEHYRRARQALSRLGEGGVNG